MKSLHLSHAVASAIRCMLNPARSSWLRCTPSLSRGLHSGILAKHVPSVLIGIDNYIGRTFMTSKLIYDDNTFSGAPTQELQSELSASEYEDVAEETLESLTEIFEEIADSDIDTDMDVTYSSGVLTVKLGSGFGTYVINKQTPNRQIWLSSPTSGPKRYDFKDGTWIYKHEGVSMHTLLSIEISKVLKQSIDFSQCSYGQSK